jgi:hypothetical protein
VHPAGNLYLAWQSGAGERYWKLAARFLPDKTYFNPLAETGTFPAATRLFSALPLRFEEQIRSIEDTFADCCRATAPCGVRLPCFPQAPDTVARAF